MDKNNNLPTNNEVKDNNVVDPMNDVLNGAATNEQSSTNNTPTINIPVDPLSTILNTVNDTKPKEEIPNPELGKEIVKPVLNNDFPDLPKDEKPIIVGNVNTINTPLTNTPVNNNSPVDENLKVVDNNAKQVETPVPPKDINIVKEESKQDVNTEDSMLKPVLVGEIDNNVNKNPIGLILFFAILIVCCFALPYASDVINYFKNNNTLPTTVSSSSSSKNTTSSDEPNIAGDELTYATIGDSTVTTLDNLDFSNVTINDNTVSVDVENKTSDTASLLGVNYYLEFWSDANQSLGRIILRKGESIAKDATSTLNYEINSSMVLATKYTIYSKDAEYYPVFEPKENKGVQELICTKGNDIITYNFSSSKLFKVANDYTYDKTNADYNEVHTKYQRLVTDFNLIEGVSATISETTDKLNVNIAIDYNKVSDATFDNLYYYTKDTEAKVIKYEMESSLYTCK